jgi:hypothetical protein
MRSRSVGLIVVLALAFGAWVAYGFQREASPRPTSHFKVTNWPPDTPEEEYHRIVERYLNEMAADGWRLSQTMLGERAKLMVFERGG